MEMVQYGMVIDLDRCLGCHTCSVACKSAWQVPSNSGRNWLKRLGPEKTPHGISYTFYPGLCNHCSRPSCVSVCPVAKIPKKFQTRQQEQPPVSLDVAAIWKDPVNGSVQIDQGRCTGCGACVTACPYEAIYLKGDTVGRKVADKCDFCVDRLAVGLPPVCVEACPAEARVFGNVEDANSALGRYLDAGAKGLTTRKIDLGPNVFYAGSRKDIYLLNKTSGPEKK